MIEDKAKSILDRFLSLTGIIILLPLFAFSWALIKSSLGSPILFRMERPGLYGKLFRIYKFRTMTDTMDRQGRLLADEQRLTPIGRFLRHTSLDELPELINVLKGEMSLVGPRPLLVEYLSRYTPAQVRRHEVKPGMTGWAQINGRNNLSWEDKFKLDVWYIDHWTLGLDIKIIALTVVKIFRKEGINQQGCATVTKFKGSKKNEC